MNISFGPIARPIHIEAILNIKINKPDITILNSRQTTTFVKNVSKDKTVSVSNSLLPTNNVNLKRMNLPMTSVRLINYVHKIMNKRIKKTIIQIKYVHLMLYMNKSGKKIFFITRFALPGYIGCYSNVMRPNDLYALRQWKQT